MKNQKRKLAAAAVLSVVLMSACMDAGADKPVTTEQTDSGVVTGQTEAVTQENPGPELPELDCGGDTFSFYNSCICDWMAINRVTADEETGDSLNDAVYRRNMNIEERYNVTLSEYQNGDNALKSVMNLVSAGDTTYSVFLLREEPAFNVVLQNGAVDYAEIPYLNLDREWWLQSSLENMSICDHVYYGISTFDTTHYDGTSALYFNKTMIDNYDLEDPYQLVADGTWTIDKMMEMASVVAKDLNGDGKWDDGDQYGYASHEILVARYLMAGVGAPLSLSKDKNDELYFDMTSDYYIERLQKIASLFKVKDGFYHPGADSANHGGYEFFLEGNVLFYNETLGNAQKLRQMTLDFGILPAPKYDEKQENYYNDVIEAYFMLVPVTNPDIARTGILMEALAYESLDTVMTTAYDGMLQGIVSRDTESEAMLDLIFNSLTYCHPVALQYTMSTLYTRIFQGKDDFVSYLTKSESKIETAIENAMNAYRENND